ncbi:hypothetical protein [Sphaerisporangium perillae]|uniref:hypothetical protein n=1 Tax=Sphaerisporangium perillae TaxID=2935860 RepID=UPI0020101A00|nr:hypothetical protein [Sphaerisporangium perillae]
MIPTNWISHRRPEDNELLGYLRPGEDGSDRFTPVNVFGYPLGTATTEDEARRILESVGLSYLAETWLLTIPNRVEPVAVQIVEATPQHLRVKNVDFGYAAADIGQIFVLDVPETGKLRLP